MELTLPVLAGMVSTAVFAGSVLPMLHKALRTRELSSYSLSNIALANLGNAVHSVYVFDLPPGPIWLLHSFYLVSSALMLYWYMRSQSPRRGRASAARGDVAVPAVELHSPRQVRTAEGLWTAARAVDSLDVTARIGSRGQGR